MTRPVRVTKTLTAASANTIAHSQSPGAAGNLTLTASPVTLDTQRRVLITSGGNDSAINFTIYGTNGGGAVIQEVLAGSNGSTAQSQLDYKTVTRIAISAASAGTVIAGTSGVGSTHWIAVPSAIPTTELSVAVEVTGTINYTVQYTYQDVNNSPTSFYAYTLDNVVPVTFDDQIVQAQTTSQVARVNDPIWGARVTINSGTGSITANFIQTGIASS